VSIFSRGIQSFTVGRYPQFNNYVSPLSQLYGQTSMTSAAGERIDEWTALGVSAVLGAVSLLADSVASMPLRCYTIDKAGKRTMKPLPDVLADPDPESNTYELLHQVVASMALHGNAYVKIDRDRNGTMIGLVPLHPYQMQVLPTGDMTGRRYLHLGNEMNREDVLHLRWFTPPQSLVGISPLNQTRNLVAGAPGCPTLSYSSAWFGWRNFACTLRTSQRSLAKLSQYRCSIGRYAPAFTQNASWHLR